MAMRALICAAGTTGDIQPMLALAVALKERGHTPHFASTPKYAAEARALGMESSAVSLDWDSEVALRADKLQGSMFGMVKFTRQVMREEGTRQLAMYPDLAKNADLVVGGTCVIGGRTAAEAARVPYRRVSVTTTAFPSAEQPPFFVPLGHSPRWLNRLAWGVFHLSGPIGTLLWPGFNDRRRELGLEPVRWLVNHVCPPGQLIVAADPDLCPMPSDFPAVQVGAFFIEDPRQLAPELDRFLAEGDPPIYAGFGPYAKFDRFAPTVVDAMRTLGMRGVVCSPGSHGSLGSDVHVSASAPHQRLFPRVRAIVHHAGAGTLLNGLRAGAPQVLVPYCFDQFRNAEIAAKLGIAEVVMPKQLTSHRLVRALKHVMNDEKVRSSTAELRKRVCGRDGLAAAVALLEQASKERIPAGASSFHASA